LPTGFLFGVSSPGASLGDETCFIIPHDPAFVKRKFQKNFLKIIFPKMLTQFAFSGIL